ncbi:esterase/lipase family protein [Georgenia sp. Z1344]|uniref:esterase/lipase family protein n=1 Tax=Georgenia sp. Z1344 TaxID=3416706 RepID=UPI003CF2662C
MSTASPGPAGPAGPAASARRAARRGAELLTRPLAHGLDYAWVAATAARSAGGLLRRDRWRPGTSAGTDTAAAPVLLLPGVYESWHMLARVGRAIVDAGHPVGVVPDLGLNGRPVADGARRTADHLARLGLRGVVLVAHSKGGLVGKATMLGPEGHRVAGLVAVATPWRGSVWARAFPPRSAVGALSPRGPDLVRLAGRTDVDSRIVSLAPAWDPHIPGGSFLPGARNVRLRERGHFRPLGSPAVHALVVAHVRLLAADAQGGQDR